MRLLAWAVLMGLWLAGLALLYQDVAGVRSCYLDDLTVVETAEHGPVVMGVCDGTRIEIATWD